MQCKMGKIVFECLNMKKERLSIVWGIIMTLFYLGMAFLIVFSDIFHMGEGFKIIMALLFFLYGIFRGYRVWQISGGSRKEE